MSIKINIPATQASGKYTITQKIIGTDLFTFFKGIDSYKANHKRQRSKFLDAGSEEKTPLRNMIIKALVRKQLLDTAFIRTRQYGFEEHSIQRTSHYDKLVESFTSAEIFLSYQQRETLRLLGTKLDGVATYQFRDAAPWNYILGAEQCDLIEMLAKDSALPTTHQKDVLGGILRPQINKGLVAYDLDKLTRLTFQQDDAIHALEWPYVNLNPDDKLELECDFLSALESYGEDTSRYWDTRSLAGFYRHLRMWHFYNMHEKSSGNYPDPDKAYRNHHLSAALHYLHPDYDPAGAKLGEPEKIGAILTRLDTLPANLMVEPDRRPK